MTAHFHAMEARALARLGDATGCDRALAAAVTEHERRGPEDDPGWFRYFDEAELSAEMGHCLRDLGRAEAAAQYAGRSVGIEDGKFVRSDFFATMVLADSYLGAGEAEQACDAALAALSAGEQIRSLPAGIQRPSCQRRRLSRCPGLQRAGGRIPAVADCDTA